MVLAVRPVILPAGRIPGLLGRPLAPGPQSPWIAFAREGDAAEVPLARDDLPDVSLSDLEDAARAWLARNPPAWEIAEINHDGPIQIALVQGHGAADHVLDAALMRRLQAGLCGQGPLAVAIPSRHLLLATSLRHAVDGTLIQLAQVWYTRPRGVPISPGTWLVDGGVVRGRVDIEPEESDTP